MHPGRWEAVALQTASLRHLGDRLACNGTARGDNIATTLIEASLMNRVIVFSTQLLPYSQTFIREQVRAFYRWYPVLIGESLCTNGLSLDNIDVRLLCHPEDGRLHRLIYRICRLLRLPHPASLRRLREIDALLIHVHFGTSAVDVWPLVRALGLPMLVTLHGFDINIHREWWEAGKGGWRRRRYPELLLQLSQRTNVKFIAVSEAIRARAIEFGIPANKITVCYIGVDTNYFRPHGLPLTRRRKRILHVGRLVEKKGTSYLIRAFTKARELVADMELTIIGDGPLRPALEQLAADLGAPVEFLGVQSSEDVRKHMHQARVLCLSSVTAANGDAEGLPIAILEAQACGLPVVTSARGGVGEAIHNGYNGLCFGERDVHRLCDILVLVLSDDATLIDLSSDAHSLMKKRFDLRQCTQSLEDQYSLLIRSQPPSTSRDRGHPMRAS